MSSDLPKLYLARHGHTAWTDSHQVVAGLRRAGFLGGMRAGDKSVNRLRYRRTHRNSSNLLRSHRLCQASAKPLRQHGHSPSCPLSSAENAVGCGSVMIALNASGARWA
jgi:hypothetical protein